MSTFDQLPIGLGHESGPQEPSRAEMALAWYSIECQQRGYPDRHDLIRHGRQVGMYAKAFGSDWMDDRVLEISIMHDLADRVLDEERVPIQRQVAAVAIQDYLYSDPELHIDTGRVAALLAGTVRAENSAESYRRHIVDDDNSPSARLVHAIRGGGPIEPKLWLAKWPLVDFKHLKEAQKNNIESIFINAIEMIDNLRNPGQKEISLLQDIIETETFHSILAETLGFDALVMKLRTEALKKSHERSGPEGMRRLEQAQAIHENAKLIGVDCALDVVLGTTERRIRYKPGELQDDEESPVYAVVVPTSGLLKDKQVVCRLKVIGSIADKLFVQGEEEPIYDICGITVICDSQTEMMASFADTVSQMSEHSNVKFRPAYQKTGAVYVQGDAEYISLARTHLADIKETVQYAEKRSSPDLYKVCKLTCLLDSEAGTLPVEVQFLTAQDRINARRGLPAHIFYKLFGKTKQSKDGQTEAERSDLAIREKVAAILRKTHRRKYDIDHEGVRKCTKKHGEEFLALVEKLADEYHARL